MRSLFMLLLFVASFHSPLFGSNTPTPISGAIQEHLEAFQNNPTDDNVHLFFEYLQNPYHQQDLMHYLNAKKLDEINNLLKKIRNIQKNNEYNIVAYCIWYAANENYKNVGFFNAALHHEVRTAPNQPTDFDSKKYFNFKGIKILETYLKDVASAQKQEDFEKICSLLSKAEIDEMISVLNSFPEAQKLLKGHHESLGRNQKKVFESVLGQQRKNNKPIEKFAKEYLEILEKPSPNPTPTNPPNSPDTSSWVDSFNGKIVAGSILGLAALAGFSYWLYHTYVHKEQPKDMTSEQQTDCTV